ncbi:MAG: DUF2157 domain-containing protein [Pseudomonadota bacterium]|nr:DUF2157 domain-containing protein [Pseudomonadota bacterium]
MPVSSRNEAQQRADDIHVFRRELSRLELEGVLHVDEAQREALATHHDALLARLSLGLGIDRDPQSRPLSLGMRIASFIGALALAASVFFLFHQFWGYFATAAQVTILVSAAIGAFLLTMWVDRHDATGYFTNLAAMVAFACFVLNIGMLGQIFDITPSDKALLPWAAFAFVLAYTFELRLLQAAGILCLIAFISSRTGSWSGTYWIHFGDRPENFFPAAVAIFLVPQALDQSRFPGFAATYRVAGALTLFVPVLVLANWGNLSDLDLDQGSVQGMYQAAGFLGSAALVWYGVRRHWQEVTNTGVTFFVIFLYSKLFDWWWDSMPKSLFFLLMGLAAVFLLLVFQRLRRVNP